MQLHFHSLVVLDAFNSCKIKNLRGVPMAGRLKIQILEGSIQLSKAKKMTKTAH